MSASGPRPPPAPLAIVLAFVAVYVIWGSTYLAIRWSVETMPPLLMAAVRFLTAGAVLYGWYRARGMERPSTKQWTAAAISGGLLLAGGNGAVVVAVQWVPSGLAALLVASVPLWIVLVDWLAGARVRPATRSAVGVIVGFAGIALLAGSPGVGAGGAREAFGAALVLGGALSWAVGSIYSKYATGLPRPGPLVSMQMLAGGGILLLMSLAAGEPFSFDVSAVSLKSALALVYLITFGGMVAYTAYIWLLTVVSPVKATTYAYVNPLVAMFLGWALADEPLTFRSLGAAAIILGAVVLITTEAGTRSTEEQRLGGSHLATRSRAQSGSTGP